MRTTLTLDPDVVSLLEAEVHRRREPFKQVVNDAIRRGLTARPTRNARTYRVRVHHTELAPGVDRMRLNALAEELEEHALRKGPEKRPRRKARG
jgi:hypothetical protein